MRLQSQYYITRSASPAGTRILVSPSNEGTRGMAETVCSRKDLGSKLAAEFFKIHATRKTYDEAFRVFRGRLLADPPPPQIMPIEWLPVYQN